jgi:hypothetical protein
MPPDHLPPAEARAIAGELVRRFAARAPGALELRGVDLGPALEQQVFFALRDGAGEAGVAGRGPVGGFLALARAGGAFALSLVPRGSAAPGADPIVAIIRLPARMTILDPIEAELRRRGSGLATVRVARAAEGAAGPRSPRLLDLLHPGSTAGVVAYQPRLAAALRRIAGAPGPGLDARSAATLRVVVARELPRIAIGVAAVESLIHRWRPSLLIAFDEVGTWSRIIPAVARRHGVPSLNLPHAEAADPIAIAGADYDTFAVFGPRAAAVFVAAGIDANRIARIGAPHFDGLIARPMAQLPEATAGSPRRILFAAQYVQGAMTRSGLEACHRAALSIAAAVAPAEVIVVPHPVQPPGQIEGIVADVPAPPGIAVRVDATAGLHASIDDAWLLVTGWSNSVFEAALRRVPTIMVDADHASPVAYATEGLAIGVATEAAAASAARALLDPDFRAATIDRAVAALATHLGPLDGRSSARAAELIESMARRKVLAPG